MSNPYDSGIDFLTKVGDPLNYVKQVFISLLESIFSEPILYDDLPNPWLLVYNEQGEIDQENSKIMILDVYHESGDKVDPRPVVVVKRADVATEKQLLGNTVNGHGWGSPTSKYFVNLMIPISITAYSRNQIDVERIATAIWAYMLYFSKNIRHWVMFETLIPPMIGLAESTNFDSKHDLFKCDVTLAVSIPLSWEVSKTGILDKIDSICIKKFVDNKAEVSFLHGNTPSN